MRKKHFISVLFCLLITNIALAQPEPSNVFSVEETWHKHQLGIGISRFVNAAFPSDSNAFLLEYRYVKTPKMAYRVAGDYRADTSEDSFYDIGVKFGFDRTFKSEKKWRFYYGIDLWSKHLTYAKRKQHHTNLAVNPFFGISYQFNAYFSVSTEPGFFVKYNISKDNATFDPNNNPKWFETRLAKIGYIQLNFCF